MHSFFTAAFFAANRQRLLTELPEGSVVVLQANALLQRTADTPFPFQQESNFWYLCGIDEPNLTLVFSASESYLILPTSNHIRDIFDGAPDVDHITKHSGISTVLPRREGIQTLKTTMGSASTIFTPLVGSAFISHYGMYRNSAQVELVRFLKRTTKRELQDVRPKLARLRMIKQAPELQTIEAAVRITQETLNDIRAPRTLRDFTTEYELEAAISHGFRKRGASGHGYQPIVATGHNATTLHYVKNNDKLADHELIVLDVGAEVEHYSADLTRVVSRETPTSRQQQVLEEVVHIQAHIRGLMRPGVLLRDIEKETEKQMGQSLVRLGLITSATDHDAIRHYYPHSVGHYLGLDVHDTGDYSLPLTENTVLTCEPGIYIPEESIGVRLEDDLVITKDGSRVLGIDCPYLA